MECLQTPEPRSLSVRVDAGKHDLWKWHIDSGLLARWHYKSASRMNVTCISLLLDWHLHEMCLAYLTVWMQPRHPEVTSASTRPSWFCFAFFCEYYSARSLKTAPRRARRGFLSVLPQLKETISSVYTWAVGCHVNQSCWLEFSYLTFIFFLSYKIWNKNFRGLFSLSRAREGSDYCSKHFF